MVGHRLCWCVDTNKCCKAKHYKLGPWQTIGWLLAHSVSQILAPSSCSCSRCSPMPRLPATLIWWRSLGLNCEPLRQGSGTFINTFCSICKVPYEYRTCLHTLYVQFSVIAWDESSAVCVDWILVWCTLHCCTTTVQQ